MTTGRADSSGSVWHEQWEGRVLFLSDAALNLCLAFLKRSHEACHLEQCVCRGEGVWVCFSPVEGFLGAGGFHPTRTRLKAKKLCLERC